MREWKLIATIPPEEGVLPTEFDVWLDIPAGPSSFGFSDSFRVCDAYRKNGHWFHRDGGVEKQLRDEYVTHWMPLPAHPTT